MNPARWRRIEEILDRVMDLPRGKRTAILDEACHGEPELRADVESLLAADDSSPGVLDLPVVEQVPDVTVELPVEEARDRASNGGPQRIGHYRIECELGAGGMGTVYAAWDERMKRHVALKLLPRSLSLQHRERFEREAWLAGKLMHPNLVKVFDRGIFEDTSYFTMELVDGGSLQDVIDNFKRHGRDERWGLRFGSRRCVHWTVEQMVITARALDYAHRQGVVHRDIKPVNLLLTLEGPTLKIADFGLAVDLADTRITESGAVMGTVRYMAPEQILAQRDRIDARTDVYALGVTLFELLTLKAPFVGKTRQTYMNAVLTSEARRASKLNQRIGRDLEIVLRKALEKDPRDRYASAADFADDLDNVLHLRPIAAEPPARLQLVSRWVRRNPFRAALVALLAVGLPLTGWLSLRAMKNRELQRQVTIERLWKEALGLNRIGDAPALVRTTTELLELDPDHRRALWERSLNYAGLAMVAVDPAQIDELQQKALADADRLIELEGGAAWPYRIKAFILRKFGRESEADAVENERPRVDTGREPEELYYDGLLALERNDPRDAVELLSAAIAQSPRDADAIEVRGHALLELGDYDRAIEDFRLLQRMNPDDYFPAMALGTAYTDQGRLEDGERYLRRAAELIDGDAELHERFADNQLERGRAARSEGDVDAAARYFAEAEEQARTALALDPGRLWCHVYLGAALMELHRLEEVPRDELVEEALSHYERARSLRGRNDVSDPDERAAYGTALVDTCDALIQIGSLDRALDVCTEAVAVAPEDPAGYYNLAAIHALSGRADEAFRALERDFELGDRDHEWLAGDAWFESIQDDPRFANLLDRMRR